MVSSLFPFDRYALNTHFAIAPFLDDEEIHGHITRGFANTPSCRGLGEVRHHELGRRRESEAPGLRQSRGSRRWIKELLDTEQAACAQMRAARGDESEACGVGEDVGRGVSRYDDEYYCALIMGQNI